MSLALFCMKNISNISKISKIKFLTKPLSTKPVPQISEQSETRIKHIKHKIPQKR